MIGPVPGSQSVGFGNPGEEVLHMYDAYQVYYPLGGL